MGEINSIQTEDKLRLVAEINGRTFDSVMCLYLQEKFMDRLAASPFGDRLILKEDPMFFYNTKLPTKQSTKLKLLSSFTNHGIGFIADVLKKICTPLNKVDEVYFDSDKIEVTEKWDVEGRQINILLPAYLVKNKYHLEVTLLTGDILTPNRKDLLYQGILTNKPIRVTTYPAETLIADMLEKCVSNRLKMNYFYKIFHLALEYDYDGRVLQEAICETFQRRGTDLVKDLPLFTEDFSMKDEKENEWEAFIKTNGYEETVNFTSIMATIRIFLHPIYDSIIREEEFFGNWNHKLQVWG
ncbi:nucleotidyl transferase AbiEii/AbiGii toxin family protein [Virgibacillus halodenitrificans]|uniref:nucleotidyl transferase AbiEii/AbiGii toxin family protein n=1 Tax=Virgibacillus halodenitrificans TaxID=1482 RepID=UPI001F27EC60|nr:nucleotidyl transferase AbiEii/AbiGii toxin family protein [Virgibacillus halodenitrificans]MCG1030081.1 nucleotidyl transferase AbiEii/AbiGii toxin family protein [Virgibacillus halodenitrificans]